MLRCTRMMDINYLLLPKLGAGWTSIKPGAGQDARGMPGGPSVVTEGYRRSRPLPPTLATKKRGDHRFTDAPVIYSVSWV